MTKATSVCSHGELANSFLTRLCGLLGKSEVADESGLLISPSTSVHTFGMRFAIDIVAMDKQTRVVGVWEGVGPWQVRGIGRGTRSVLELASGQARRCGIAVGDYLTINKISSAGHAS